MLTTILRYDHPTPLAIIEQYADTPKVLSHMLESGQIRLENEHYSLTERGAIEANFA
nr:hypothetical protein [uncultured Desulfobulbus sp.]